jgi:ABC-2 type transport system ATP-binding protein
MQHSQTAITVDNLHKSFKKVSVLQGLSFTVETGKIFALLGANGAGKTTAINIMTTLLHADKGTVMVHGFNVAKQPGAVRKHISLTGQFAAVDEMLTARENLILISELRHVKNPNQTADELLKQFDLSDAASRPTAPFSGGMRRRLDIAMSLIGNPSIIFLDEPTTGLDPQSRNAMWATIRLLAAQGKTIFLTTQYLEEADQLADHIAILVGGKIAAEGTPDTLKKTIPHGQLVLTLRDQEGLERAAKLFRDYDTTSDDKTISLTITTDGSLSEMTKLLNTIEEANIAVVEFAQKAPSLDDAFLKIIDDNQEEK